MHAEIIAVGDEITSGRILDTNSRWLTRRLDELGVRVLYHTSVGDELDPMTAVVQQAIDRSDLVFITGGLGPTADDLTREAIAAATGRELTLCNESLEHIRQFFVRLGREMPQQNQRQARLPAGAKVIPNPNGTAPGIDLQVARAGRPSSRLFALPGVPAEMREMWYGTLVAELQEVGSRRVICRRQIKCFGAGESDIEAMLPDLIERGRQPTVGINASRGEIVLRISAAGTTEEECQLAMEPTTATIRKCLGDLVYTEEDEELQDVVAQLLQQKGKTLATVEWGTAGQIAQWLDGSGDVRGHYLGGLVVQSQKTLSGLLDIAMEPLGGRPSTGNELVRAMAVASREWFGSDLALAVGPFPQRDSISDEPRVVHLALASRGEVQLKESPFGGHPALRKILCAKRGLNMVRLAMLAAE